MKFDGRIEPFSLEKLRASVEKALKAVGLEKYVDEVVKDVLSGIHEKRQVVPSQEIADRVERAFIERVVVSEGFELAARRYLLARIYNHAYGKNAWSEISSADLSLTYASLKTLVSRYLIKDPSTLRLKETPSQLFWRVANYIASAEKPELRESWARKFYELMSSLKFLPNSPTLMNAGSRLGILSACFVIPVRDALSTEEGDGIYDALRAQALIFQQGGGCGFDFSELRPEGDVVASTAGVASGPLSFIKVFDVNTEIIKQGGRRRGANMGVLHVWHPDIEKFILSKSGKLKDVNLQNFNISVGVYDYFMESALKNQKVPLINPRRTSLTKTNDSRFYAIVRARHYMSEEWVQELILKELEEWNWSIPLERSTIITIDEAMHIAEAEGAVVRWVDAGELLDTIVKSAWDSGDPGILFIDTINKRHSTWYLGKVNSTNPCGEQPLLEWESCNLGSLNLEKYVLEDPAGKPTIDWKSLAEDVRVAVRFLDNVISVARYPLKQLQVSVDRTRKVGLGVMGWAHMLIKLGIKYDSPDAIYLAYHLAEFIAFNAYIASIELAREKGSFQAWDPKLYRPVWHTALAIDKLFSEAGLSLGEVSDRVREIVRSRPPVDWGLVESEILRSGLRNAALLSIAPTGTLSIIAGTSSSIEPIFALAFTRVVTVGTFIEINRLFLEALRRYELDEQELVKLVAESGSIAHSIYFPKKLRELFRTAHDISHRYHVYHQATWQQWVDAGVSKTVNMVYEATPADVLETYLLAWKLGCKGITIYRDKSKSRQVIYFGVKISEKTAGERKEEKVEARPDRFRATAPVLKEGEVGGCPTCEY
ncbi:MAG: adenosylcobalamin-dependent ribonucleoside-diphosphate reductase [Sulfolobales archaeon]|nr:adenosylcobalamin-dependent ribonucleoside-diphosphate reductase [Sulfolobales archaeon]